MEVLGLAQLADLGSAAASDERPPAWLMPFRARQHLVLAVVVAWLAVHADVTGWVADTVLGLAPWVGFPVVLLASSAVHEKVPWRLAAPHAGDWLAKLLIIAVIVAVWS